MGDEVSGQGMWCPECKRRTPAHIHYRLVYVRGQGLVKHEIVCKRCGTIFDEGQLRYEGGSDRECR